MTFFEQEDGASLVKVITTFMNRGYEKFLVERKVADSQDGLKSFS